MSDATAASPSIQMQPVPSEDEAAAIVAALCLFGRGGGDGDDEPAAADPGWRFSGRWWTRPVPLARQRPYRR